MPIERRLTITELGDVGDDKSPVSVRLAEVSPLETTVSQDYKQVTVDRGTKAVAILIVEGITIALTAASTALPLTLMQNQELANLIAIGGGLTFGAPSVLMGCLVGYDTVKDYVAVCFQKKKAQKLTEQGYVFAHQLKDLIIVPSAVEAVDTLPTSSKSGTPQSQSPPWYAVKEQYVSAPVISLLDIGYHVGKTVIVCCQITAVGNYGDMKLSARGEFSGTLMGTFPLQMKGSVDGRVFTEDVSFRIGDSEGNSIPAYLGYMAPHLREQLPLQLRGYSSVTRNASVVDKTQFVNFLNETLNNGRQLSLLGKLDKTGSFSMEALGDPGTKQVYALTVYQQLG